MCYKKLSLMSLVIILSACGGSGGDDDVGNNSGVPAPAVPLTGIFLDSPVANVDYTNATGSHMGATNSAGEFEYLPNETLVFSIGDLEFPSVSADAIITPMDMARTLNIGDSKVTNIVRLLLTLDQDANPENGITITDTAKAVATQVDFLLTEEEFAASSAVTNLIFNGGQDAVVAGLVSTANAISHFETQLNLNNIPFGTVDDQNDDVISQYLTDNNLQAIEHESGLYYDITVEGSGDSPLSDSTVELKYKGYLLDGTVFDQTSGDSTIVFNLANLITGWQIGVPLLKPGGAGTFYLPASLAYGPQGSGIIPPNAVIVFDIELVNVQ